MTWQVMPAFDDHERARREFAWDLPETYNPAVDFLRKHEDVGRTALRYERPDGDVEAYSFADLDDRSDRLAAALAGLGVEPLDSVGVVIPQRPANPLAHLANWKVGAVSVPLTVLFGRDALQYRLRDSEATAVVVDEQAAGTVQSIRGACPDLEHVIVVGGEDGDERERGSSDSTDATTHDFDALLTDSEPGFDAFESTPETPSAIMYTSGSTGPPKGVRHRHALWLGRAAAAYNYFDRGLDAGEATLWTPADWAWGAALGGTLFAAWHHGCTVVGWPREGFDAAETFDLLERHEVTHPFMPPTALRLLTGIDDPESRWDLSLSVLASAGEPLTPEVVEWVDTAFDDVAINEFYGQTELNLCVASTSWFETRPGSMGKPLPGYEVAILDPEGTDELGAGEAGELAVKPGDERVFFAGYRGLPEKTAAKRTVDGWFRTGDLVERDEDGYLWFVSRADDVILTSGYRVGPMEVEEAILRHELVEQAGVVGVPDEVRGEAIKAFVQPATDAFDPDELRAEIRQLVRDRLAEYEYPREIEFVDQLPTTSTGKIRRLTLRERETDE